MSLNTSLNPAVLQQTLDSMVKSLRGIVATDIWVRGEPQPLASYMHQPAACQLFDTLTTDLMRTLAGAGFPGLKDYFLLDMEGTHVVLVILHGTDVLQGILFDTRTTNVGSMLALGLPMAKDGVKAARG